MSTKDVNLPLSRRQFLVRQANGIGLVALAQLLAQEGLADSGAPAAGALASDPLAPRSPHHRPRAKNVIFIFMAGGPSHLDLYDPKPQMARWHGQRVPESLVASLADKQMKAGAVMASPRKFQRYGRSGIEFSDFLPQLGSVADELCVIRSMHGDQINHDPAQLLFHCGTPLFGHPSFGSWVTYGLGSVNQDLPGYVVLLSNSGKGIDAGSASWGNGFLPSTYRGVPLRSSGDPILHLNNPPGISTVAQRARLDALRDLNQLHLQTTLDAEIASRIGSYELAFRMQSSAPELLDFSRESAATRAMYGLDADKTRAFGTNCLLARRMIERGVRCVQLFHSNWDDHTNLAHYLKINCDMTDLPAAALVRDLKQRGLLDDTLVVWTGEFGRTPMNEIRRGVVRGKEGRDHHPYAFSMWMAGGGVKRGYVHGRTDDFGFHVVDDGVHVHDAQATILHLLGLDHRRLTFRHAGRDFRLTDVSGTVVEKLLS